VSYSSLEADLYRSRSILGAIAAAWLAAGPAGAQDLSPTPPELKLIFDSYTRHIGLDPNACRFGLWNGDLLNLSAKEAFDNAFARCKLPPGYKICTRIAGELPDRSAVENGCITGFERLSFLALSAVSTRGGFFVVVHDSPNRPIRLAQQLTLGFGPDRDFCELNARLIDSEAKLVAGTVYHNFLDLLEDETICRKPK
jgi:hypothetical protein